MAKKYYWLKLNEGFFDDKIIKKLRKIAGGDTYVIIYLKMQLLSIKTEGKLFFEGIEGSFEEELALDIGEDVENVKVTVNFLEKLNLLESSIADEYVLPSVLGLIGSESESAERVRRYRENKENNLLQCNVNVTDSNSNVTSCNTEIEKEIEIDIDNKKHICAFFEQVWNLYPNKKGKGQISDSKKKLLFKIGIDELTRAIERYKAELQKDEWRKQQNGSTFFNSGYLDYLDGNYSPSVDKPNKAHIQQQKSNKAHQFPQRSYTDQDYANIEKGLMNKNL